MIAQAHRGGDFAGLFAYLMTGKDGRHPERVEWTATRNLPFDKPALAPEIMAATADQNLVIRKPVYHLSVSLDPNESLDRRGFERVVDRTLADLGLGKHQALIVAHNDRPHDHVHVMVNTVHPETGRSWRPSFDYARIERSLRQQEQELGLRQVPGRHFALDGQERFRGASRSLPEGAFRAAERTGKPSFVELARQIVRPDLRRAKSWIEIHRRLDEYGLGLAKRGRGLVLTNGEQTVKLSLVDRQSSLSRLEKRCAAWQPPAGYQQPSPERWRDVALLRRLGERLSRDKAAVDQRERVEQTARFERHRAIEEAAREQRQLSDQLDHRLARIYRDPGEARRRLMDRSWDEGALRSRFVPKPEAFGQLRGRGGFFTTDERWDALETVPEVAQTLLRLGKIKSPPPPEIRHKPSNQSPAPHPTRRRDRLATRLVQRMGWKLVARILPPSHLTAVRLALSVSRKALDLMRDPDLGRGR